MPRHKLVRKKKIFNTFRFITYDIILSKVYLLLIIELSKITFHSATPALSNPLHQTVSNGVLSTVVVKTRPSLPHHSFFFWLVKNMFSISVSIIKNLFMSIPSAFLHFHFFSSPTSDSYNLLGASSPTSLCGLITGSRSS